VYWKALAIEYNPTPIAAMRFRQSGLSFLLPAAAIIGTSQAFSALTSAPAGEHCDAHISVEELMARFTFPRRVFRDMRRTRVSLSASLRRSSKSTGTAPVGCVDPKSQHPN
jgi:hypothetical protein